MHAAFIPYGKRELVDRFLREIEAQKFKMPFKDTDGKESYIWISSVVRVLPLGIYEVIFPEESKDLVLTSLGFHAPSYPQHEKRLRPFLNMIRSILNLKKAPKFDTKNQYLWLKDHVSIIPLGVRYDDKNFVDPNNQTIHEAL